MQLRDLMQLFREGQNEGRKRGYVSQGACDAEGIAAVIRAVRDEFGRIMYPGDDWNRQGIMEQFDQILDDAGEKVAGASKATQGTMGAQASSANTPATDPASAVCEWTPDVQFRDAYYTKCSVVLQGRNVPSDCPSCGKPITFTEAK